VVAQVIVYIRNHEVEYDAPVERLGVGLRLSAMAGQRINILRIAAVLASMLSLNISWRSSPLGRVRDWDDHPLQLEDREHCYRQWPALKCGPAGPRRSARSGRTPRNSGACCTDQAIALPCCNGRLSVALVHCTDRLGGLNAASLQSRDSTYRSSSKRVTHVRAVGLRSRAIVEAQQSS
jgi:hypothetical protein